MVEVFEGLRDGFFFGLATGFACMFTDGFCNFPPPTGTGVSADDPEPVDVEIVVPVDVDVVVVVPVDVVVPVLVPVDVDVDVVLVVSGGAAGAAHDSEIAKTGSFTGNDNADTGVPAVTVNDSFAPPTTVTVTTH